MENNPQLLWERCLAIIRDNLSEQQFSTWFKPVKALSYEEEDKVFTLQVPSQFFYEFLEENYLDIMQMAISKIFGEGTNLMYQVVVDQTHDISTKLESSPVPNLKPRPVSERQINPVPEAPQDLDPRLNPNYNFKNFIEGVSNRLSRAVGVAVAEKPAKTAFNPLFIYGPSGVGKTHLVNAIGTQIKLTYPQLRVLYVSAHLFMVQYTDSIRNNTTNSFLNFYQTIDVLIIDDIQELSGLTKTQNTFFHIFNHLHLAGKQLILTSDRAPAQMQGFEDRLLTRFKWGMLAELDKPNPELRKAILKNKIIRNGLNISDDIIDFIASTVNESVRDLEGIVNSLLAYSAVYNCEINMQLAERVINRTIKLEKKQVTVDEIIEKTCQVFEVQVDDIFSRSRKRPISMARQVSMYLTQKYTNLPVTRIGVLVGKRDHATVLHSIKQISQQLQIDKKLKQQLEDIENELKRK